MLILTKIKPTPVKNPETVFFNYDLSKETGLDFSNVDKNEIALIFSCGHIIIAMSVVSVGTGASLFEAGIVALVEPTINGVWYYALDKMWSKYIR